MSARPGEDELIARYFAPLAASSGALQLTDDAAFFSPPAGCDLVVTKDALVAGVHFYPDDAPALIARKALRVNLSDLAAKGATPFGYLLAIALPADWSAEWLAAFASGLAMDQAEFGITLLGGDTVKTPGPLMLSITAIGTVPQGRMVRRAGALPGDLVAVSGTIGDAALGCKLLGKTTGHIELADDLAAQLKDRYWLPRPRLALAPLLQDHASAAMDVSDGLAGDLAKLCRVSGVEAQVRVEDVPLSLAARAVLDADDTCLETILGGGDDYEIVFTAAPERMAIITAQAPVPVSVIGHISAGQGGVVFRRDGQPLRLLRGSYAHF
jgi:thiamine-monophosphate kinase